VPDGGQGAGGLRQADEVLGGQQPVLGVLPAQQGLHRLDAPAGGGEDGLVVQAHLVEVQGVGEVALQLTAVAERGTVGVIAHHDPSAPGLLGRVHGGVGVVQQRFGAGGVHGQGDPDAGGHDEVDARHAQRLGQHRPHPGGDGGDRAVHRLGLAWQVLAQQDELVPGQAGQGVPAPLHRAHPAGDFGEDLIACGVPEGVVDLLEPVQVDEHHPNRGLVAGRGGQGVLDAVEEQPAVG